MRGKRLWEMVPGALLAVAVLFGQQSLSAQESWQPARGGASRWGSGPAVRSTPAAGSGSFGGGARWSAGNTSFGSARQPGGVWISSSGFPATSKSASGPDGVGSPTSGATPKPAEVRLLFPTYPTSAPKSKAQVHRAGSGQKSVTGPHFGMTSHVRTGKSSTAKKASFSSRSHASSGSRTGMSSGFGKTKESSSGLSPTGETPSESESPLGAPSESEDPLR